MVRSNISGNNGSTFHYDGAGNLDCRSWNTGASACNAGSTTLWYSFNLPKRVESTTDTYADFSYGPNRERVRTTEYEDDLTRVIYRVGPHFEVEMASVQGSPTTTTRYRSTDFFGERTVYARVDGPSALLEEGYLHPDHLGSLDRVTAITGNAAQASSFDAFGKRRNTDWSNDNTDALFAETQWLERGYTGHQHLDGVRLIHMNGRVQNPIWGRMLSPDPVVGDLTLPQSLNAYSYVMNNPLAYTDPTGYIEEVIVTGRRGEDPCQRGTCDPDQISVISLMGNEDRLARLVHDGFDSSLRQLQARIAIASALFNARYAAATGQKLDLQSARILNAFADWIHLRDTYRNNASPRTTIFMDASDLTVRQLGPFGENGTARGTVEGVEFALYGTVTLQLNSDGPITAGPDRYDFEMHSWLTEPWRNILTKYDYWSTTAFGLTDKWADLTGGHSGTPFMIEFTGTPTIVTDP